MRRRLKIDWFMTAIAVSALVASIFPATGIGVPILSKATVAAIAILFFLYGVRLEPRQAWQGLTHWRLHTLILSFTFVFFPLLGLATQAAFSSLVPAGLMAGLVYTCLVPSTVQSSIAFTSIAKGNVAGAIVSASISNLVGVVITPMLAIWLMTTTGSVPISPSSILDISAQILLPFVLGQLSRKWTFRFVNSHPKLKLFDQFSIVLVVYAAFSSGIREGIWSAVSGTDLVLVSGICLALLAIALWATMATATALKFDRGDRIAIQFCGTKKSLATGLPMAMVMFPAGQLGLIMIPLMIFHMTQLIACSYLAAKYAKELPK